jgi:hypothetical protein
MKNNNGKKDNVRRYLLKRFKTTICEKCGKLAEVIPYEKINHAIHDLLLKHNVFSAQMYYCDYCYESDWKTLTHF